MLAQHASWLDILLQFLFPHAGIDTRSESPAGHRLSYYAHICH
jgi:hypothetical protein